MGSLFENGYGVERDLERASALYAEAARLGCDDAADRLVELGHLGFVDPSILNRI